MFILRVLPALDTSMIFLLGMTFYIDYMLLKGDLSRNVVSYCSIFLCVCFSGFFGTLLFSKLSEPCLTSSLNAIFLMKIY